MQNNKKVAVIGAGGHIGFPFSIIVAQAGYFVYGVDVNRQVCSLLNNGIIPYIEHGADNIFGNLLRDKQITFTSDSSVMCDSDIIAIMIGTPVDGEGNPRLDDILDFVDGELLPCLKKGQLIILRSTVSPGTTEIICKKIKKATNWVEGVDFHLVFCPERVAQTYALEESKKFPQLIGAFSKSSYEKASEFFSTFVNNKCFHLTPREAEIGKLITNMYRYVNFALANQFYMIADKQGVDIHKVINAANYEYDRLNIPLPGPNVGGPCLFKDGKFLLTDIYFSDLIQTSFIINEGMPDYIFNRIKTVKPDVEKILILGLTFKANCDDTRNSLSYKLMKVCKKNGIQYDAIDPHVSEYNLRLDELNMKEYDAAVLMTPHKEFKNLYEKFIQNLREDCIVVDIWKSWPSSQNHHNGIYKAGNNK